MHPSAALLALVLLFAAPSFAEEEKPPLERARELKEAGEYDEAEVVLRKALEAKPEDADLLLELGKVSHVKGRDLLPTNASLGRLALYDAKTWYQRALEARPKWGEALQLLGTVATELGDLETAADAWKRAAAVDPGNGECRYQLGYCLALLGRFPEAIAAFRAAEERLGADPRILLNRGICHASLEQVEEAEKCFTKLVAGEIEAGRRGGDRMNRGVMWLWRLHSRAGRFEEAETAFATLARKYPDVSALHWYLGHARSRQGDARGAAEAFRRVTELLPSWADGYRQFGETLVALGEYEAAEEALRAEAKLDPGGEAPQQLLFLLVSALKREGRLPDALAVLDRLLPAFPGDSLVLEARGDLHFAAGSMEAALADYRKAAGIDTFATDPVVKAEKAATALLRAGKTLAETATGRALPEAAAGRDRETILDFERSEVFVRVHGKVRGRRTGGRFSARRTGGAGEFANVALTFIPTLDTRPYRALRFAVKGPKGSAIGVRLKDAFDEFGMSPGLLRIEHVPPVELTGDWQTVTLPLAGFAATNPRRPIPLNRARLRAIAFQLGEEGGEEKKLAEEVLLDDVALVPAEGEPLLLADFDREPEETLFVSEGAATAFARTLFTEAEAAAFRPDANTYVNPAIFGDEFDAALVHAGRGSFRLTLAAEGPAAGALTFNPDRSFDRAAGISFFARGEKGGEMLRVTIEDAMDADLGNTAPASAPRVLLDGRQLEGRFSLSSEWREYRIPRSLYPDVNFDALLAIRFHMGTPEGNPVGTRLYLDDIGVWR